MTDISDEVQWRDRERTAGSCSHRHPTSPPLAGQDVAAAILNEAGEEDYL